MASTLHPLSPLSSPFSSLSRSGGTSSVLLLPPSVFCPDGSAYCLGLRGPTWTPTPPFFSFFSSVWVEAPPSFYEFRFRRAKFSGVAFFFFFDPFHGSGLLRSRLSGGTGPGLLSALLWPNPLTPIFFPELSVGWSSTSFARFVLFLSPHFPQTGMPPEHENILNMFLAPTPKLGRGVSFFLFPLFPVFSFFCSFHTGWHLDPIFFFSLCPFVSLSPPADFAFRKSISFLPFCFIGSGKTEALSFFFFPPSKGRFWEGFPLGLSPFQALCPKFFFCFA